jgi:hypothetical protein
MIQYQKTKAKIEVVPRSKVRDRLIQQLLYRLENFADTKAEQKSIKRSLRLLDYDGELISKSEDSELKEVPPPIEPIEVSIKTMMSLSDSMNTSIKLREQYKTNLFTENFVQMENALFNGPDVIRAFAKVNNDIVGIISYYWDEITDAVRIDHIGTMPIAPKGTGAELVRYAIRYALANGVGIWLESVPEAKGFWERLGFKRYELARESIVFHASPNEVGDIMNILGNVGRVNDEENSIGRDHETAGE